MKTVAPFASAPTASLCSFASLGSWRECECVRECGRRRRRGGARTVDLARRVTSVLGSSSAAIPAELAFCCACEAERASLRGGMLRGSKSERSERLTVTKSRDFDSSCMLSGLTSSSML